MNKDCLSATSYCGLYCADCPFGTGTIPDLARDLRKELRSCRFDKVAETIPFKEFEKYSDCYEVLGALVKLRCKGCRTGTRSRFCNIAECATRKGYRGCWECGEFTTCKKLQFLEAVHGEAHKKNMRKINRVGIDEWAKEKPLWYSPPGKRRTKPAGTDMPG
ncbi:MAG: DUF3795 domain-containing protein [Actinobacteria bacterium]|nr:DUF3795 domain-containing protein [Actinomycetota bacterium]